MRLLVFPDIQPLPLVPSLFMLQWLAHAVCMQMTKILRLVRTVVVNASALLEQPHYPLGLLVVCDSNLSLD